MTMPTSCTAWTICASSRCNMQPPRSMSGPTRRPGRRDAANSAIASCSRRGSDYPPILNAHEIPEPFSAVRDLRARAARCRSAPSASSHGRIRSLGFRFGPIAYSPDVDGLDDAAFAALEGVECWIVDALRYTPHPSHAHLGAHPGMDRAGEAQARHPHQHACRPGLRQAQCANCRPASNRPMTAWS